MYCKNLRIRQKKYIKFYYCFLFRQQITLDQCKKCLKMQPRVNEPINKKSNKQQKLEKSRYSILTNDLKHCYICGKPKDSIHEIYKGSNRTISMKNGFCVPLCDNCHKRTETDIKFYRYLQKICREKYLESNTVQDFVKKVGRTFYD